MNIAKNTVVQLEFDARMDGSSLQHTHQPKLILIGRERDLPPGLEDVLIGRRAGETFTASLENAFGTRDERKVLTVSTSDLPTPNLEVGARFTAQDNDGNALEARVVAVDGDQVTVDMNHPRAGKTLEYTVTIHAVREADAHELEHGHAHGEGGVVHDHEHHHH
jgi:FKBP-type peptidyl-prolyl cis-trans isomerase SlyD